MSISCLSDNDPRDQDGATMLIYLNKDELLRHGGQGLYDNFL